MKKFESMESAREEYSESCYEILTDDEANERCKDYILETLWAFNADFLAGETGIDSAVFEAIQGNGKCEDNNEAIKSCIDDLDSFVESAIGADGRGHFLSSYDGEENEIEIDNETYYVYRTN